MNQTGTAHRRSATNDFVLRVGGTASAGLSMSLSDWHHSLGGTATSWRSEALGCEILGGELETLLVPAGDGRALRLSCLLVGAPVAGGTLDCRDAARWLLSRYALMGIRALRDIEGTFCGVLADEAGRQLWLFTDRFGFRKAFRYVQGQSVLAASRSVVLGRGLGLAPDRTAVATLVLTGHVLGTQSLFSGCQAVPPATACDLLSGQDCCYWDIRHFLDERPRDRSTDEELRTRFNDACHAILKRQAVPALNLTGGFDTRAVLSAARMTGEALVAVTSGRDEASVIDALVRYAGLRHHYFVVGGGRSQAQDCRFAFLTDGEWATPGGGVRLEYWKAVSSIAPSGCLHGGLGEAWRGYHYKFLWPPVSRLRRDPLAVLTALLTESRSDLHRLLRGWRRGEALEAIRGEIERVWNSVCVSDRILASVDAFYIVERQRALNRISSAADRWNSAYAPFGHEPFLERALSFLGPQNRDETLHRAIIAGNDSLLGTMPIHGGGNAAPRHRTRSFGSLLTKTGRHVVGQLLGPGFRAWYTRTPGSVQPRPDVPVTSAEALSGVLDMKAVRAAYDRPESASRLQDLGGVLLVFGPAPEPES